jgi:hypothetical protein
MQSPDDQVAESRREQSKVYFDLASELSIAENAIKREATTGHNYLDKPLTPEQIKQRQAILEMARAVIAASRDRALDNFHALRAMSQPGDNEGLMSMGPRV